MSWVITFFDGSMKEYAGDLQDIIALHTQSSIFSIERAENYFVIGKEWK